MAGNIDKLRMHMASMMPKMPSMKKRGTKIRIAKMKMKSIKKVAKSEPDEDDGY